MSDDWANVWAEVGVDLHLDLPLDPAAAGGRRAALEQSLREAIRTGRLAPGTRLPASRALAGELHLARGTVTAAYDQLVAEGYLTARVGAGTEVARLPRAGEPGDRLDDPRLAAPRYDLRPGLPDVTTFPTLAWLRSMRRALTTAPAAVFGHGDPRGRPELRVALAEYLGRARGVVASPDRIVVTAGYVQALSLLATVLGGSGPIAMEDPGLPLHREVVRRAGGRLVGLPVDERGARTDQLWMDEYEQVCAVVVTPAHQYPTGVTLHPQRRHDLTAWAVSTGGLVIEDDYDGEFRYDRQPVGALQGTAPEHVVYVGTASKTLGPAVRLAWLVLPERLIEPVAQARFYRDLHGETPGQLALADLVSGHSYDRHIRASRLRYRTRRDDLLRRLAGGWAARFGLSGVAAGLHVMITLPAGCAEDAVLAAAAEHGLAVGALREHWYAPSAARVQGIIVGYATPPQHTYPAALDTLVRVLRSVPG